MSVNLKMKTEQGKCILCYMYEFNYEECTYDKFVISMPEKSWELIQSLKSHEKRHGVLFLFLYLCSDIEMARNCCLRERCKICIF